MAMAYPPFSGITRVEKIARDRDHLEAELEAARETETLQEERLQTAHDELGLLQRDEKAVKDKVADIDRSIDESEAPRPLIGPWLHVFLMGALFVGDIIISTERFASLGMHEAVGFGVVASLIILVLAHLEGKLTKDIVSPESPKSRWGELAYLSIISGLLIAFIAYYTTPPLELAGSPEQQTKEAFYTGCIYLLLSCITAIIAYHGTDVDPHRRELRDRRKTAIKQGRGYKDDIATLIRTELRPAERKLKDALSRRKGCVDRLKTLESQVLGETKNVLTLQARGQAR